MMSEGWLLRISNIIREQSTSALASLSDGRLIDEQIEDLRRTEEWRGHEDRFIVHARMDVAANCPPVVRMSGGIEIKAKQLGNCAA